MQLNQRLLKTFCVVGEHYFNTTESFKLSFVNLTTSMSALAWDLSIITPSKIFNAEYVL